MIDPVHLYSVATHPAIRGWEFDLRYMVCEQHFADIWKSVEQAQRMEERWPGAMRRLTAVYARQARWHICRN